MSCNSKPNSDLLVNSDQSYSANPNILIFYVDDLGYGDVSCYGAKMVQTPNVDALAENGVRFTDAHSSAATCTPSRYSLLTGNYAFRMKTGILPGDAPLLIDPETPTLATKLKNAGYRTGVVGKWHLGLGDGQVNWNEKVFPGPKEIGFDYSFLLPSTGDRVPSVFLENQKVVNLKADDQPLRISFTDDATDENPYQTPTGISHPELLRQQADKQHSGVIVNGVSRIGFMEGGESAWFVDEEFPKTFVEKAEQFITSNTDAPFFLYFSFHDIHVPRVPHKDFIRKTDMGPRGDAIVQMDWTVGQIMDVLQKNGLKENTLVIFTSDNGPVLNDGYEDDAVNKGKGHQPAGIFRGGKYSIYEGGSRVPTIVYWPKRIRSGSVNKGLWNQLDLYKSLGSLVGYGIEEGEAIDSQNMLDVFLGESIKGRTSMVNEAFTLAYRQADWKYIKPTEKGHSWIKAKKNIEGGISKEPQLYNLLIDSTESNNLALKYPYKVLEMDSLLQLEVSKKLK